MERQVRNVNGLLHGGRAACAYIVVGGRHCSQAPGACEHQSGATPSPATAAAPAKAITAKPTGPC